MTKVRYLICGVLVFGTAGTHGYELSTHARLTEQAYDKSDLPKRMADYGIDVGSDNPFGSIYYDVTVSSVSERAATAFEAGRMTQGEGGTPPRSIKGWLTRGAIREDDITSFDCTVYNAFLAHKNHEISECNPQDDPRGNFTRVFNHFYDPINDRGWQGWGGPGQRATDWAIGAQDASADLNQQDTGRRNHFTVFDAREAMYRALTGMDSKGTPLVAASGGTLTAPEDIRKAYWATTFRALGDVAHLLQDRDYRMEHLS